MIRILVAVEDYPNNWGGISLNYVRVRNVYYKEQGINVTVLNFKTDKSYIIDDIPVLSYADYKSGSETYDILVCHAANLKHHLRFLVKYGKRFPKYLFFYHGHEVMDISKDYAKPYPWFKSHRTNIVSVLYDRIKFKLWHKYLTQNITKSHLVFVSHWMLDTFEKNIKITKEELGSHHSVIYNSVGKLYEVQRYDKNIPKKYDLISIRSVLDVSKYCVDLINKIAFDNPSLKFLLVGKGTFFDHVNKAPNIEWCNEYLDQTQIIKLLNQAKIALMPTRTDAQGVMMCEMATFGIPVITSDIPVCREVFENVDNVMLIPNDMSNKVDLKLICDKLNKQELSTLKKYTSAYTVAAEVSLIKELTNKI